MCGGPGGWPTCWRVQCGSVQSVPPLPMSTARAHTWCSPSPSLEAMLHLASKCMVSCCHLPLSCLGALTAISPLLNDFEQAVSRCCRLLHALQCQRMTSLNAACYNLLISPVIMSDVLDGKVTGKTCVVSRPSDKLSCRGIKSD